MTNRINRTSQSRSQGAEPTSEYITGEPELTRPPLFQIGTRVLIDGSDDVWIIDKRYYNDGACQVRGRGQVEWRYRIRPVDQPNKDWRWQGEEQIEYYGPAKSDRPDQSRSAIATTCSGIEPMFEKEFTRKYHTKDGTVTIGACTCKTLLNGHQSGCLYYKHPVEQKNVWGIMQPKPEPDYMTTSDQHNIAQRSKQ